MRRLPGEGTVYRRSDGRWEGRLFTGAGRRSVYGRTRADVQRKLSALREEMGLAPDLDPTQMTVGELLDRYIAKLKRELRPQTVSSYQSCLKTLAQSLRGRKLRSVTPLSLEDHLSGLKCSPSRLNKYRYILRAAFRQALLWRLIPYNPVDATSKVRVPARKADAWSAAEVRTFLSAIRSHRWYSGYLLLIAAGLRRGEVLGLEWRHLSGNTIRVEQQLRPGKIISVPKTHRSTRAVALPQEVVDALDEWMQIQAGWRVEHVAAGFAWQSDLMFTWEDGSGIDPKSFTDEFQRLAKRAGLRKIKLHDLRHTYATLALDAGAAPKLVAERLGHSNQSLLLSLYGNHVFPEQREEAQGLDELLGEVN